MAVAAATAETPTNTNSTRSRGWAQLVRGAAESVMESPTESSVSTMSEKIESCIMEAITGQEEDNVVKKPAWNKPANGVSASSNDYGGSDSGGGSVVVMGGTTSWPALSDYAKLSQKEVGLDSPRSTQNGSQVPATSNSQQSKQGNANTNHNSSTNSAAPARQRSMKCGGGGNRQGGSVRGPPPPPPLPVFRVLDTSHTSFSKGVQMVDPDFSLTGARPAGGIGSQPSPSYEHPDQRSSNRRANFGHRGRGNGRNNYHGARRELAQGNHEWNPSQNTHIRGAHGHPQGLGWSFVEPRVQGPTRFAPPPHLVPYGPAIAYPDIRYVYFYTVPLEAAGGMPPFLAPAPPPPPPPPPPYLVDSALCEKVVRQIDYYFSDDNLVKDEYLKSKMTEEGWVSIGLIASFPRVQSLNVNIPNILEFLRASTVVEVQGDNIRRREDWMKWVPMYRSSTGSGVLSPVGSHDNLARSLQKVLLEEVNEDITIAKAHLSSSNVPAQTLKEMSGELPMTNMEATIQHVF